MIAVTVDHRLYDTAAYPIAAADVRAAVKDTRALEGVDAQRVALWFFSGGGLLATEWLADPPPWLRCVALTYPVLAPPPGWGGVCCFGGEGAWCHRRSRLGQMASASSAKAVVSRYREATSVASS